MRLSGEKAVNCRFPNLSFPGREDEVDPLAQVGAESGIFLIGHQTEMAHGGQVGKGGGASGIIKGQGDLLIMGPKHCPDLPVPFMRGPMR